VLEPPQQLERLSRRGPMSEPERRGRCPIEGLQRQSQPAIAGRPGAFDDGFVFGALPSVYASGAWRNTRLCNVDRDRRGIESLRGGPRAECSADSDQHYPQRSPRSRIAHEFIFHAPGHADPNRPGAEPLGIRVQVRIHNKRRAAHCVCDMSAQPLGRQAVITPEGLQSLIVELGSRGYAVIGPTVRAGTIVYDEITHIDALPRGWTDRQDAASYHLERRADDALFGYAVGPHSWKQFLHPPVERLWRIRRDGCAEASPAVRKLAFLGVRACELRAMAIQDRVLLGGAYRDAAYERRRRETVIIAVNCSEAAGTCFCVSMQAGPAVDQGFDLALTELAPERHELLVQAGSALGEELLARISCRDAQPGDTAAAAAIVDATAARMGRVLETDGLQALLQSHPEHPRWDDVAQRCLTCGNCTMVCPTCFCTTVQDSTDLAGETATRERKWDSCFTLEFSHLHGGSVRTQARSRYRQWMTHKLAHWFDQFGTSGCVGCGRCITWCPVGIDITAEAAAIRATAVVDLPANADGTT
jgi:ferredoxin